MERRTLLLGAAFGFTAVILIALAAGLGWFRPTTTDARLSVQESFDFGRISATQRVVKTVEFTNIGSEPLVIKDVLPVPPPEGG